MRSFCLEGVVGEPNDLLLPVYCALIHKLLTQALSATQRQHHSRQPRTTFNGSRNDACAS